MDSKKPSLRKCIGCFSLKEKKDLLRLYKDESGELITDVTGKGAHRGAYICKCSECVSLAAKRKALEHSFRMRVDKETYNKLLERVKA